MGSTHLIKEAVTRNPRPRITGNRWSRALIEGSVIGDSRFYRTLPVQQRSHDTVVAVLEAARQVHAEEGLSASLGGIAARAGVTGPGVFRYFDDIHALRGALVSQSRWRYLNDVADYLDATTVESWRDIIMMHVEIRARSYRDGDAPVAEIAREPSLNESNRLALFFGSLITEYCGIKVGRAARQRLELGLRLADSLIRRAFLFSDEGDPIWISACENTVVGFLGSVFDEHSGQPKISSL
ncbi:TetR/AcrR family transcriptional regulator [Agreia sp. PsM10]|uniref:TetR/AcrR family transcriptional regulator n=1 Tax=Agreia sp. PsM10 TaxID=3030533 RepID=UPI00263B97CA|nr:TetR/AcrR family transcriptional regulator [Agreia sp. PsM10]MDN4641997.1 TetR/AcrR family transcriptional regulator [Agreia sp. PsM10]